LNRDIDLYVYKMPKPICYFLLEEIWLTGTNYVCCSQKILSTWFSKRTNRFTSHTCKFPNFFIISSKLRGETVFETNQLIHNV
jgi:hypothetical protein